jgi:hypothetical protein
MTTVPREHPDPLIDEVRQRRRELMARYGNDLSKLLAAVQERQAQHPELIGDRRKGEEDTQRRPRVN